MCVSADELEKAKQKFFEKQKKGMMNTTKSIIVPNVRIFLLETESDPMRLRPAENKEVTFNINSETGELTINNVSKELFMAVTFNHCENERGFVFCGGRLITCLHDQISNTIADLLVGKKPKALEMHI